MLDDNEIEQYSRPMPMWMVIAIAILVAFVLTVIIETQVFDDTHITNFILSHG